MGILNSYIRIYEYERHDLTCLFLIKVVTGKPNECWPWTGSTRRGYGMFKHKGIQHSAHRFGYALFGPLEISSDLEVHHICENRGCCNPDHWQAMTSKEHKRLHLRLELHRRRKARRVHDRS